MKMKYIAGALLSLMAVANTGCDEERDLIVIDENLPVKSNTLYLIGGGVFDANEQDNAWKLPSAKAMTKVDNYKFEYEGGLYLTKGGDFKMVLTRANDWSQPFIMPIVGGTKVTKEGIYDAQFDMHTGEPDNKWYVQDEGVYKLSFDLHEWTYSMEYLRKLPFNALFIIGSGVSTGWKFDTPMEKTGDYTFTWTGDIKPGKNNGDAFQFMKAASWSDNRFVPEVNATVITPGQEYDIIYSTKAEKDNCWNVPEHAVYTVTVDLDAMKMKIDKVGEYVPPVDPLANQHLYLMGRAVKGSFGVRAANVESMTCTADKEFTWKGTLTYDDTKTQPGEFLFITNINEDGKWQGFDYIVGANPAEGGEVKVSVAGGGEFPLYTVANEDGKGNTKNNYFKVEETGEYTVTVNLNTMKMKITMTPKEQPDVNPDQTLYLMGRAGIGSFATQENRLIKLRNVGDQQFVYEGTLKYDGGQSQPGQFLFITNPNENGKWDGFDYWIATDPVANGQDHLTSIEAGGEFGMFFVPNQDGKGQTKNNYFMVEKTADWKLEIDLKNKKMKATRL